MHPSNYRKNLSVMIFVSTFGGLLFGYDTGVVNGALPFMSAADQLNLDAFHQGLVVAILQLGAAVGAIGIGKITDLYGRRKTLLFLSVLFFAATLSCSMSPNVTAMVIARFTLGLAVGGASVNVPTYLAEISPAGRRGKIVTRNELMIVSGQLLAFFFNAVIGINFGEDGGVWRYMLALAAVPAVALGMGMFRMPESPRWLIAKKRTDEGAAVLGLIRPEGQADKEIQEIKDTLSREASISQMTIRDLGTAWVRRLVFIGIGMALVNQFTGINSIMYYGTEILKSSGFSTEAALIGNIGNGAISLIAMCCGIAMMDRFGRRPMILTGLAGVAVMLVIIGMVSVFMQGSSMLPFVTLGSIIIYLAFFQGLIGPVNWLIISEIFPLRLRGLGMGVAVMVLWIANFCVGLVFPILLTGVGLANTFFTFAAMSVLSIIFVIKCVPETRGHSLEELERFFIREYGDRNTDIVRADMAGSTKNNIS